MDPVVYTPHIGQSRSYWRDAVLGINDGLVSMALLIVGVAGGGLTRSQILLTGIAGALAGAVSMGTGEYLATKSQDEVFESEVELEKEHIEHFRRQEVDQLFEMLNDLGVDPDDIEPAVAALSRTDKVLLNSMKVLEFGMVKTERRRPAVAMLTSGGLFLAGATASVVPFVFPLTVSMALMIAVILAGVALFAVGVIKTRITRTNAVRAGLENLLIAGAGGVIAYVVGRLVGSSLA
ncbi:MAG: VIT1/CCC1 transporter family protein [Acidimicrobiia bacterium]|nr:VIT1/CCC1 transporter family protein [Acidimicrobiia bacterium]MDQ3499916.1 VIT1/CCC1 transporter family protein [Actinomycetota bacterium]